MTFPAKAIERAQVATRKRAGVTMAETARVAASRTAHARQLRSDGLSYAAIGRAMGVSPTRARELALRLTPSEMAVAYAKRKTASAAERPEVLRAVAFDLLVGR